MADTPSSEILLLSTASAAAVDRGARSVVAVHGRDRLGASGVLWRDGVVVAASDAIERDEDVAVTLPDGRRVAASVAGRDPTNRRRGPAHREHARRGGRGNGRSLWIEFKKNQTCRLTAEQNEFRLACEAQRIEWHLVYSAQQAIEIVATML